MSVEKTESGTVGVIPIGTKTPMNYVMAMILQMNKGVERIVLKARGRAISRAVDVAEIARLKFIPEKVEVSDIKIGTEEIFTEDGAVRDVSVIEIELKVK